MSTDDEIGARIRDRRIERGLSQTSLADGFVSPSYLSLLEAGKRHAGTVLLTELARRLLTTADWLRTGDSEAGLRQEVGLERARLLLESGQATAAADASAQLLERSDVSPRVTDEALFVRARALASQLLLDETVSVLLPLHERALRGESAVDVARTGAVLVRCLLDAGDLHQAADVGRVAVDGAEEQGLTGTDEYLRLVAVVMGAHAERGDLLSAEQLAHRVLEGADDGDTALGRGDVHWAAAQVAEERGRLDLALHHVRRARSYFEGEDSAASFVRLRLAAASLLLKLDPPTPDVAESELGVLGPQLLRVGTDEDVAAWNVALARAALLRGDVTAAAGRARDAVGAASSQPGLELVRARLMLGDALQADEKPSDALVEFRSAASVLGDMPPSRHTAQVWRDVGERLRVAGDVEAAVDAFRQSLDSAGYRQSVALERILGAG